MALPPSLIQQIEKHSCFSGTYDRETDATIVVDPNAPPRQGPNLFGVVGRPAGSLAGFKYSPAFLAGKDGIVWDEAVFAEYIKDPRAKIPGTKMIYAGLKDEKRVADLIAFLKQYGKDGKKPE